MPDPSGHSTPTAVSAAVRQAAHFNRSLVSPVGGLLGALPVAAVLGLGIAAGKPVAGVTMGAGAMLVGIAWRIRGGRAPLGLMATDAGVMALSTFVGCVTGSIEWLHLVMLAVWALVGGLMVALGPGGGVLGNQALLAAIVFGRFSQPIGPAATLAGLVLAGGATQVVFQTVVRWPTPLQAQRGAVAAAYRLLAGLARSADQVSPLDVGAAFDAAEAALAAPTLLGDPALLTLRSLVNEGQRMLVQLLAIGALAGSEPAVRARLEAYAGVLDLCARAIEGDRTAARELADQAPARLGGEHRVGDVSAPIDLPLSRRLAALAGQLRAVATLAPAAGEGGGLRSRRPLRSGNRALGRWRTNLESLRANASLSSPAGRHAVRLAVIVVVAELISRHLPLQRSYWMVVAAVTTVRPEFGATFTRGTERAVGTCLGVALAGAITVGVHPAGGVTVALVAVLAWAAYSVFPASFAAGFAFITALVVFLLNAISPDTLATAWARLVDTLVGGGLGLAMYAAWPTWGRQPARHALADLVGAERAYFDAVMAAVVDGRRARADELRPLARRARLARTQAESAIAVSLSEPQRRRIESDQTRGALGALRRLMYTVHVLRLEAEDDRPRHALPALRTLVEDIDRVLDAVEASLRADSVDVGPLPDLRSAYEAFERTAPQDEDTAARLLLLDEIVDAVDTLAEVLGLDLATATTSAASNKGG